MSNPIVRRITLFAGTLLALLLAQTALAAPGGNNGGGLGGLAAEVAALEAEVAVLAEAIDAMQVQTVSADCGADAGALQAAIDAAPPAGAIIEISGVCGPASIDGKANLLLNGGGTGSGMSGLSVSASRNIQLAGLNVYGTPDFFALNVVANSSVFATDVTVDGNAAIQQSSTLNQFDGTLSVAGELQALTGGQIRVTNGTLGGFALSRSGSLVLFPDAAGKSIEVNGSMGTFSASSFLAQGTLPGTSVTLNGVDDFFIQRNAAVLLAGAGVSINVPQVVVRQNSVYDVISMFEGNYNVPSLLLNTGGGSRIFFFDATGPQSANCDASAWTDGILSCAP